MLLKDKVTVFKKTNGGDVMGVIRTLFPNVEIETKTSKRKKNKS